MLVFRELVGLVVRIRGFMVARCVCLLGFSDLIFYISVLTLYVVHIYCCRQ